MTIMNNATKASSPRRLWAAGAIGAVCILAIIWPAFDGYCAVGFIGLELTCDPSIPGNVRVSYGIVPEKFIEQTIDAHRQGNAGEFLLDEILKTEPTSASLSFCESGDFIGSAFQRVRRYPESETILIAFEYPDGRREYQTVRIPWESVERPVKMVISLPKQVR